LQVESVEAAGKAQRFALRGDELEVHFEPAIEPAETISFAIRYGVRDPRHGLFFVEPTPEYPDKIPHLWSQNQDEHARYWFPCLDYPHAKQTSSATIVVPQGQFALSNGALVERTDRDGKTVFRYEQHVPHSTYLITLVVGPFAEIRQREGAKPVFYYVLPGREADGERAFGKTPRMIDVFEERIGHAYPYERYSQIAVTDFIFGGMENTTATTQTDRTLHDERAHLDFSSDPLVSHELAHQWFGDLLTCRDWSHAWLNEGFATYFEAVCREADLGYDEYLYDIFGCVSRYLHEDADRYRRPIVCNRYRDPIELFDRHLYEKGAAVLHMLRGELGETRFWRSIRHYVKEHAQRSVETIDLIRSIESATGRNMREFFDQWVFRGGHPELEVSVKYDEGRKAATLTVEQKQRVDEENPDYRFDVDLAFGAQPERRVRVRVERAHETFTVPLDAHPDLVRFDPGAYVLGSVTYKFGATLAAATLERDPDVVARIRAARELANDGSREAREALAGAFARETFWGVLTEAAHALGETQAPWAREILLAARTHEHPKVRRAVASALGSLRNPEVADALAALAKSDPSYFVQADALTALGKTRDARAFDILREAVKMRSWNGTVEAGAARGLGELADPRATDPLIEAAESGKDEGLRRAALGALARHAELVQEARAKSIAAVEQRLDDPMFLVQLAAISAAERLQEPRLISRLEHLAQTGFDGRVRRDALDAIVRIREAQKTPAQVSGLRSDVDRLREEFRTLQEKLEALSRS
jgi:aminopeptidase N